MKCNRCGFENPKDAKFCLECGADLTAENPYLGQPEQPQPQGYQPPQGGQPEQTQPQGYQQPQGGQPEQPQPQGYQQPQGGQPEQPQPQGYQQPWGNLPQQGGAPQAYQPPQGGQFGQQPPPPWNPQQQPGQPQQPYGEQDPNQRNYQAPPPPPKKNNAKVIAAILAGLVVLAGVGFFVVRSLGGEFNSGSKSSTSGKDSSTEKSGFGLDSKKGTSLDKEAWALVEDVHLQFLNLEKLYKGAATKSESEIEQELDNIAEHLADAEDRINAVVNSPKSDFEAAGDLIWDYWFEVDWIEDSLRAGLSDNGRLEQVESWNRTDTLVAFDAIAQARAKWAGGSLTSGQETQLKEMRAAVEKATLYADEGDEPVGSFGLKGEDPSVSDQEDTRSEFEKTTSMAYSLGTTTYVGVSIKGENVLKDPTREMSELLDVTEKQQQLLKIAMQMLPEGETATEKAFVAKIKEYGVLVDAYATMVLEKGEAGILTLDRLMEEIPEISGVMMEVRDAQIAYFQEQGMTLALATDKADGMNDAILEGFASIQNEL